MPSSQRAENVATIAINNITIISCVTRIPTESLPYVESKSSLSHNSFNITIVELNAVAIPIYTDVIMLNQKRMLTMNQAIVLQTTCKIQTRIVFVPNH
jgi:hypothetical protein